MVRSHLEPLAYMHTLSNGYYENFYSKNIRKMFFKKDLHKTLNANAQVAIKYVILA